MKISYNLINIQHDWKCKCNFWKFWRKWNIRRKKNRKMKGLDKMNFPFWITLWVEKIHTRNCFHRFRNFFLKLVIFKRLSKLPFSEINKFQMPNTAKYIRLFDPKDPYRKIHDGTYVLRKKCPNYLLIYPI